MRFDPQRLEDNFHLLQAPAGQPQVPRMILGTGDDPGLVIGREAHRLRLVEFRILKGGQPHQTVAKGWR